MAGLTFDAERHEYKYDGKTVPSVTQLVAPLGESYEEMDELTEISVDAAAERGTVLHAYIAWRLDGGTREEFEMPDEYGPWADGADLMLAEHEIEPLLIEAPLGCEDYAGTPDLVCMMDGKLSVLDYKFVSTVSKSKVGAQLAGYAALLNREGVFPEQLIAVQFTADGSYRFYPVGMPEAREAFDACLLVYSYKTQKHPRGRIYK